MAERSPTLPTAYATDPHAWFAAELLASPALQLDTALLCAATVAGEVNVAAVLDTLDTAALGLFGLADAGCEEQSERLARILTNTLGLTAEHEDPAGLLIDHALASRAGHPLLIACIGSELARRAGLCSYPCQSPQGWWTALVTRGHYALVGANPAERPIVSQLQRRCPHQIAHTILTQLHTHATGPQSAPAQPNSPTPSQPNPTPDRKDPPMAPTTRTPPVIARAHVATPRPAAYMRQLCKHFAHKIPASFDEHTGHIDFPDGSCELIAATDELVLVATADNPNNLGRVQHVIASHLERFGQRDQLTVHWTTPTASPTDR